MGRRTTSRSASARGSTLRVRQKFRLQRYLLRRANRCRLVSRWHSATGGSSARASPRRVRRRAARPRPLARRPPGHAARAMAEKEGHHDCLRKVRLNFWEVLKHAVGNLKGDRLRSACKSLGSVEHSAKIGLCRPRRLRPINQALAKLSRSSQDLNRYCCRRQVRLGKIEQA